MKVTDRKLQELRAQVDDNMADAEVGPLLDHIAALGERKCFRCELGLEGYGWICPRCHEELTGFWAAAEADRVRLEKDLKYHLAVIDSLKRERMKP